MTDHRTEQAPEGEQARCEACPAPSLPARTSCLAHVDPEIRAAELQAWAAGHGPLHVAGTAVSADLLAEILAAAPADDNGRPHLRDVDFDGTMFGDAAGFDGTTFGERARFSKATFGKSARFAGATFGDNAYFEEAIFGDGARFQRATFGGRAMFRGATFGDAASFDGTTFGESARFEKATFGDSARFEKATFGDSGWLDEATFGNGAVFKSAIFGNGTRFAGATFGDAAEFEEVTFGDRAWFYAATFLGLAVFRGATFGDGAQFGPLLVLRGLDLGNVVFESGTVVVATKGLYAPRLRMVGSSQLRLGWAGADLSGASFSAGTVLASPLIADFEGTGIRAKWGADARPQLVSLRGADVAGLALTDVDLSGCRFSGAHHLDALRMDGAIRFARPPRARRWPPSRWRHWSARWVLAEERTWRAGGQRRDGRPRWSGWQPPAQSLDADEVSPARIVGLYRALRKAREDAKDEPGAADFYYGEMEMRRHDTTRPRAERLILLVYWAAAGYGLRASRAFIALAVILAAGAVGMWLVGLGPTVPAAVGQLPAEPVNFADVVLYTIATASPVGAGPLGRALTTTGEAIRIALRFTGPVLLGLALLALRGRVKR